MIEAKAFLACPSKEVSGSIEYIEKNPGVFDATWGAPVLGPAPGVGSRRSRAHLVKVRGKSGKIPRSLKKQ